MLLFISTNLYILADCCAFFNRVGWAVIFSIGRRLPRFWSKDFFFISLFLCLFPWGSGPGAKISSLSCFFCAFSLGVANDITMYLATGYILQCIRLYDRLTKLLAGMSEWQTMQTQNLLWVTTCGFKSHCRQYQKAFGLMIIQRLLLLFI